MPTTLQPASPASANATTELSALLNGAGAVLLNDRTFLRVSGSDATRWLNGMVTNSVPSLQPGEGNYNFLLNAQGRILGDCYVYREPVGDQPKFVIATDRSQVDHVRKHLENFIIMDDVELKPMDHYSEELHLIGPKAAEILRQIEIPNLTYDQSLAVLGPLRLGYYGLTAEQVTTPGPGLVPRFAITTVGPGVPMIEEAIAAGATPITPEALEHLRLLSGTPRYGIDIRNTEKSRDLPQETNQPHALNFTKGCYLGQEIVERIHSRGAVHRTLTGLLLTGPLPTPGTIIEAASGPAAAPKPVGEITSAASIPLPTGPIQLALAYLRREALAEAQAHRLTLTYPGGTATPIALPYPLH